MNTIKLLIAGFLVALCCGCGGGGDDGDTLVPGELCANIVGPLRPGTMVPSSECERP